MKKTIILFAILLLAIGASAQMVEKDTVINKVSYHYFSYYLNGKVKTISQKKTEKEKGEWIYFDRKGEEEYRGAYNKNGNKDGQWWYKKSEITYYENGKITKKGIGCIDCPEF